jgi:hypothetical protein
VVREAGIPSSVTTYPLSNEGKLGTWSDGYLAIIYAVQISGWDYASAMQPHLTIVPHDPGESPISLVIFAAKVFHYGVKLAYLKFIWPFPDLSLPERFEIVNGRDLAVSEADLIKLVKGRGFLQEVVRQVPGRPIGSTKRDCEWYRDRAADYLAIYSRAPTEEEFRYFAEVPRTTMRDNLKDCGLWPWKEFVRDAFPRASIRR